MEVRLLGAIEVRSEGGDAIVPGPQLRGLLALLALRAGQPVSTERLMDALWGDAVPARSTLQVAVSKLRRVLAGIGEPERVVSRRTAYELVVPSDAVDALRFEALVDEARALRGDWRRVVQILGRSLDVWSGEPLAGVPDTTVFASERARLEELHRIALEDLAEARIECGDHVRVVPELESLVSTEPLRERRWGLLMRALYGSGRQADALSAYHRARTVLVEEVGTEPGPELRAVYEAALTQDDSLLGSARVGEAPVGTVFRRRGNLRHPFGPCIGRTLESSAVDRLLDERRLVTVTGPGGVGKTRLALEVALGRVDRTEDGVWWVDLASARGGDDAVRAVERVLDLGDAGSDSDAGLDAVCAVLADRAVLLVFDNCEHLVADLTPVIGELLAQCGHARVLATSREVLGVGGETVFPLGPLRPEDAVALFEARVVLPIDGDAMASGVVDDICRQLDYLPLALELAAARTQHLRLDELRDRLVDRFEVLVGGSRDTPDRQQSLQAVAAWSYGLLDDVDKRVFERLAVFTDGAPLGAARAVCSVLDVRDRDVEASLRRLVDKSLVVADRSGPFTRYRMLQTLADFAVGRLADRGEDHVTRRAHALWVRELARTVGWRARISGSTVAAIHAEDAAVRDAITWSIVNDPTLALEICDDLAPYWFGAMRVSTGWSFIQSAIAAAEDADPPYQASLLAWAHVFATLVQDMDAADRFAEDAWRIEHENPDAERLGRLCLLRALAAGYRPDGELARWAAEALEHITAAGVPVAFGHLAFAEGAGLLVAGDLDRAAERLREATQIYRSEEDHLGHVLAVSRLGELAWRLEDLDLFADMHAELLELGLASRTQGVVTGATARLALAHLRRGDADTAREMARAALAASGDSFMPVINGYAFRTAGLVDLHDGHRAAAHAELARAIEAFERGAGSVGVGQATLCYIDLSRSHAAGGDGEAARAAAEAADALAVTTGDPWVCEQARANLERVSGI